MQKFGEKKSEQKIEINRKLTPQCLVNLSAGQQLADFPLCLLLLSVILTNTKRQIDNSVGLGEQVRQIPKDKYRIDGINQTTARSR